MTKFDQMANPDTQNRQPVNKASRWRLIAGIVLGGIVALLLALPSLLSTTWGERIIVNLINDRIPGHIQIGDITAGWLTGLKVSDISIQDPEGKLVAKVDLFSSDASPFTLLWGRKHIGNAEIVGLRAFLVQDDAKITNLHHALIPAAFTAAAVTHEVGPDSPGALSIQIPVSGYFAIHNAAITLTGRGLNAVSFEDVEMVLNSNLEKGNATLMIAGLSSQEELAGHFAVEAAFEGLDTAGTLLLKPSASGIPLPEDHGKVRLKADIENASVALIDQIMTLGSPRLTGILEDVLGTNLNLQVETVLTSAGPQIQLQGESSHLHADLMTSLRDGRLILERPGKLSLRLTPELFDRLLDLQEAHHQPTVLLKEEGLIELEFERLTVPTALADGGTGQPTMRVRVKAEDLTFLVAGQTTPILLSEVNGTVEHLEASQALMLTIDGTITYGKQRGLLRLSGKLADDNAGGSDLVLSGGKLPTVVMDYLVQAGGLWVDVLGDNLDLKVTAEWKQQSPPLLTIQLGSDSVSVPSFSLMVEGDTVHLAKPTQAYFQLSPKLFRYLVGQSSHLALESKTNVLVKLNRLAIPLESSQDSIRADVEAAIGPAILGGLVGKEQGRVKLSNVKAHVTGATVGQLQFRLSGDVAPDGTTPLLSAALGTVSTFDIEGYVTPDTKGSGVVGDASLSLQGDTVETHATFRMAADGHVSLTAPAAITYHLKPDVLLTSGFIQAGVPHISHPLPISLSVDTSGWNLFEDDLSSLSANGRLFFPELNAVDDHNSVVGSLQNLNFSWLLDGKTRRVAVKMDAAHQMQAAIDLQGWDSPSQLAVKVNADLSQFPTAILSALTGRNDWTTWMGQTVNLSLQGQYAGNRPGNLDATLSGDINTIVLGLKTSNIEKYLDVQLKAVEKGSQHAEVKLAGRLDNLHSRQGWLVLDALGISAQIDATRLPLVNLLSYPLQRAAVSEQLAALIGERVSGSVQLALRQGNGLVQANLAGNSGDLELDGEIKDHVLTLKTPLQLTVQVTPELRQGLLREVAPFAAAVTTTEEPVRFTIATEGFAFPLTTSNLRQAKVPHATLELGKVRLASDSPLGTILTVLQGQSQRNSSVNAWFTPIHLSLNDGIIKVQRADALVADRYPIAMWGKIDIAKDRVRLTVGLTADALREAYSVLHVDDNYMLQLPLIGAVDNISIDKAKATARVTALVAQSHGGSKGAVIGGVLDILSGSHDEAIPPPTGPLPWKNLSN